MSVPTISRLVFRHTRLLARQSGRRHASTTETASSAASNAASKTKEVASNATSKASQGLTRVTSAAGPAVSGMVQGAQTRIAGLNRRVRGLISFVESLIPPTIYYTRVGLELAKITFKGQNMSPPSADAFQNTLAPLFSPARRQSFFADVSRSANELGALAVEQGAIKTARDLSGKYFMGVAVLSAQILGFFTVGEMIGKFKIVGYRGPVHYDEDEDEH